MKKDEWFLQTTNAHHVWCTHPCYSLHHIQVQVRLRGTKQIGPMNFSFSFFFLINFIGIENNLANWWHQCWTQEIWVQPVMVHDWQVRGQNCKWRISLLRTAHFLKRSTLPNLPPNISVLHSNGQLPNFLTFPPFFFVPSETKNIQLMQLLQSFAFFFF